MAKDSIDSERSALVKETRKLKFVALLADKYVFGDLSDANPAESYRNLHQSICNLNEAINVPQNSPDTDIKALRKIRGGLAKLIKDLNSWGDRLNDIGLKKREGDAKVEIDDKESVYNLVSTTNHY